MTNILHDIKVKYGESQDSKNIQKILPIILELQQQKGNVYGRSYCRHGDLSIFLNLERKWDRLSNIMNKAIKTGMDNLYKQGTPTESYLDTVIDLASYSLLWVGYILEHHPDLIENFITQNKLFPLIRENR